MNEILNIFVFEINIFFFNFTPFPASSIIGYGTSLVVVLAHVPDAAAIAVSILGSWTTHATPQPAAENDHHDNCEHLLSTAHLNSYELHEAVDDIIAGC